MMETAKDRISNLPECLLHHILSFLYNIKDGARTSVLSKRWNYIWTTVPILDIQSRESCRSPPSSTETEKFMDFVDGTLHNRNSSNVDKFILKWHYQLNVLRVHSWISAVIRGNVKELTMQILHLCVPVSLFTCESLVSLELGGAFQNFTFPRCISFPRLKRLKLATLTFTDECWNEEIFSNSPVLEELILEYCFFDMRNLCISVAALKLLKIQSWGIGAADGLQHCALKIRAPSLVTFTYLASVAKEYDLSTFLTPVEAVVGFNGSARNPLSNLLEEKDGAKIVRLLRALAHVKRLTVNDITLQAIAAYDLLNNVLAFHNVKVLNISGRPTTDQGLIALLRATPNLELLVFHEYFSDEVEDSDVEDSSDEDNAESDGDDNNEDDDADSVEGENNHEDEDERDLSDTVEGDSKDEGLDNNDNEDDSWGSIHGMTAGCLFPQLKSICFKQFGGNPREMRWVKMILKNAEALVVMTIRYSSYARFVNAKSEEEVSVQIPSFPRASASCVFNFQEPQQACQDEPENPIGLSYWSEY